MGYQEILAEYLANGGRAANDSPVSPNLNPVMPSEEEFYRAAAAKSTGRDITSDNEVIRDINTLTVPEMYRKYGSAAQGLLNNSQLYGGNRFTADRYSRRSGAVTDTAIELGTGFLGSLASFGALGLGLVNDDLGAQSAQGIQMLTEDAQSLQSSALQTHRRADAVLASLDAEDSKRQESIDRETDGDFLAGLKRIGRDAVKSMARTSEDPMLLGSGFANAGGSLLAGGPIAKGLGAVGRVVTSKLLTRGVLSEAAALKASELGQKLAMPAAIGGMEGGGAYTQTVNEVMAMSHSELLANSPEYASLIEQGWDPQDAKTEIATSAGLAAAAIQTPTAALTGALVSKFESAPFKVPSLVAAGGNVLKEGVEEGLQSGIGQFATNTGVRAFADQNRDMLEGVGEQAGLGALFGMGSAAVIQAPGAAGAALVGTGKAAVTGAKAAAAPLVRRAEGIMAEREAASPVSAVNIQSQVNEVLAKAPVVSAEIDKAVAEGSMTKEQADPIKAQLDKLSSTMRFDPTELDTQELDPGVKETLASSSDRFDALNRAALIAGNKDAGAPARVDAAIYIVSSLDKVGTQLVGDLGAAVEASPDDHPFLPQLREYEDVLINMTKNPEVQKAIGVARQYVSQIKPADISEQAVATPKGQQAVRGIATMAETNPEAIDPDLANLVLEHARAGRIQLTPAQTRVLSNSVAITRIGETYAAKSKKLRLKPMDLVSRQILNDDTGDQEFVEKSAAQHQRGIQQALKAGNVKLAAERLRDMMMFAQHMQNKVAAINSSARSGTGSETNTTKYKALTPNRKWVDSLKGVWTNPKAKGSVRLAQVVAMEAGALGEMANALARSMPELGVQPIELTELAPELSYADADRVAEDFRKGRKSFTETQPIEEAVAPGPVQESAPETTPTPQLESKSQVAEPAKDEVRTEAQPTPEPKSESPATEPEQKPAEEAKPEPAPEKTDEVQVDSEESKPATDKYEARSPEPVPTDAEVKDTSAKSIEEMFSTLLGAKDGPLTNWFLKAFKVPAKMKSRILGTEHPADVVVDALSSNKALVEFSGSDPKRMLTTDTVTAYQQLFGLAGTVADTMGKRLQEFLDKKKSHGLTNREALLQGKLVGENQTNELLEGKTLNIVDQNEDGSFSYNPALLEGAILAGLQWFLTGINNARSYDTEAVAKILGIDEGEVTADQVNWFGQGISVYDAKRNLADQIVRYWGVSANPNVPDGYVKGIAEGVASEVIRGLETAGMIGFAKEDFNSKTYEQLRTDPKDQFGKLLAGLKGFPTAIEHAVLVEPAKQTFIGEPPAEVATNQLHGSPVQLQPQQREAIEKAQTTPYRLSKTMLGFVEMLGESGIRFLFGKGNATAEGHLDEYAKSIEGYNRTVESARAHLADLVAEMRSRGEATGEDLFEQSVFFKFGITSVGRLQMEGAANPQASKLVREVLLPTWSTLDLTDTRSEHYQAYMLAMAQHVGDLFGIKVHKLPIEQSVAQIQELLNGKLSPVIELIHEWYINEDTDAAIAFEPSDIEMIRDAFSGEVSVGAMHGLVDYARYLQAVEEGTHDKFETALYLEADGVTDGPINALVNFVSGEFTLDWLDRMNRGGLYFGNKAISLNDYVSADKANQEDLYQRTTNVLKQTWTALRQMLAGNPQTRQMEQALTSLMVELLPDLEFKDGKIELKRGVAKNPLTVTIYGSGAKGIANKITSQLLDAYYEKRSLGWEPTAQQKAALKLLTTRVVRESRKGHFVKDLSAETNTNTGTGQKFKFTSGMVKNLQDNVLSMFAKPLTGAIGQVMGDALSTSTLVRQATQVQAIHFKYAFRQAIADALASRPDGAKAKDFLSRKELEQIFGKLIKQFPMIDTGSQLVFVGGQQRADVEASEFGSDFNEDLRTPGYVYGPGNPGVSGIPYLVIATGDGQMILNALTGEQALDGVLPVFDGINLPIDKVFSHSRTINKAVYDGWLENPVASLAESYGKFLSQLGDIEMSEEMFEELQKALSEPGYAPETADAIAADTRQLSETLNETARSIKARKAVLSKVKLSVDHMASASAPFFNEDGIELPENPAEAVAVLNEMYREELAKLEGEAKPKERKAPTTSEDLTEVLADLGHVDESGSRVIGADSLRAVVDTLNVPIQQKGLIRDALNSLADQNWLVVVGDPTQLNRHARHNGYDTPTRWGANGFTMPGQKRVYLTVNSSETLAHELIHAATIARVHAYYAKPETLDARVKDSIGRIEKLMDEFMAIDPGSIKDPETAVQFAMALSQIGQALETNMDKPAVAKAAALNEFMAWVLSNQKLSELAGQTKVTNPLALIARKVLELLKKLWRKGLAPMVGEDIFTNLKFNTLVVMSPKAKNVQLGSAESLSQLTLFHAPGYGNSERLSRLQAGFEDRLTAIVAKRMDTDQRERMLADQADMYKMADRVQRVFQSGFNMTPQEADLFKSLVLAFAVDQDLDPNAQSRAQDLFQHMLGKLNYTDFMQDPDSLDPNDLDQAKRKFDLVVGRYKTGKDQLGRSNLLPAFVALANTSNEFRSILGSMASPRSQKGEGRALDTLLANFGQSSLDNLARRLSGEGNSPSIRSAIDLITARMAESDADREAYIEQFVSPVGNGIDKTQGWIIDQMRTLSQKGFDKLEIVRQETDNRWVKLGANVGQAMTSLFNQDIADAQSRALLHGIDKTDLWKPISELVSELIGRTEDNAPIYDMIKLVRAYIQQTRQIYRERLPKTIAGKFTRALSKTEWSGLHDVLAKTDLAALKPMGFAKVLAMVADPAKIQAEISRLEAEITKLDPAQAQLLRKKSQELAEFMITGKVPGNLLRNAETIARLYGELPAQLRKRRGLPSGKLVRAIDQLTSLYALDLVPEKTKSDLADVLENQGAGVEFVLDYLHGQRTDELDKNSTERGRLNHYKGHVPTETRSGASLIVASDADYADLVRRGYERVGSYVGSPAEGARGGIGYYFAPLSAKSPFNQGIAQNVRRTLYGVDPVSGFTQNTHGVGRITEQSEVARITRNLRANGQATEPLMPIYDDQGDIVAYERTLAPEKLSMLEKETDLSKVLGIWRGRQVEEAVGGEFNRQLVGRLHTIWDERKVGEDDEFVDLFASTDTVVKDAVSLLTPEMRRVIEGRFGGDGFMVRKSMVNDVVGYRTASIGDAWTGVTRLDPRIAKVVETLATGIIGKNAYKHLVVGEKLWQNFVSDARTTIVVRSVVVPAANFVSNVYQLASRGVPIMDIARGMPRKLAEIRSYHMNHIREIELEAEMRAAGNDPSRQKAFAAELKSIKDSHKRLSIWPLIAAGEFSSVSEATVMREETTLMEGRMSEFMEKMVDKLPEEMKTLGRYAIISRDTALYQGLQRAVEYGDFLAKAVLYDDLVKRQGQTSEYALARISDEFVNYDRLPGRFRGSLENMGLLWFYHFKLRAMKVAMSTLRNNPLNLLLSSLVPAPDMVGSPVTDNVLAVWADGKLGYSMGPLMGVHAHALNPWLNLID